MNFDCVRAHGSGSGMGWDIPPERNGGDEVT
jgi:hypothetical protein